MGKSSVSPLGSTYHIKNEGKRANMVKPITGMLRRGLVLDLSVAFGLGTASGYFWWYGSTCQLSAAATCSTRSSKTSAPRLSAKHKRLPEHEGNGIILTAKYTMVIRQQRDQQRGMRWGRVCEIIEVERKG